jgi:AcrR family transcriptional regulator
MGMRSIGSAASLIKTTGRAKIEPVSKGAITRASILQAAVETACQQGFEGLNLQPLADRVGMTKSGLYAHFGSKEALQRATLEHATELFEATVIAPGKQDAAGLPRLEAFFGRWLEWPRTAGFAGNCPFLAAAQATAIPATATLRPRLQQLFKDLETLLQELLASAVRHGHLATPLAPEHLVDPLIALRFWHQWRSGLMADPDADARTRAAFQELLGSAAGSKAASSA